METQKNSFFTKNSELSMEFSRYVLEHPEIDKLLTEEKIIVFLPGFASELRDLNLRMAKDIETEGEKVLYVKSERDISEDRIKVNWG